MCICSRIRYVLFKRNADEYRDKRQCKVFKRVNMKHICLDIGNVICKVDFTNFMIQMSSLLNITKETAWQFLVDVQPAHDKGQVYIDEALTQSYMPSKAIRKQ